MYIICIILCIGFMAVGIFQFYPYIIVYKIIDAFFSPFFLDLLHTYCILLDKDKQTNMYSCFPYVYCVIYCDVNVSYVFNWPDVHASRAYFSRCVSQWCMTGRRSNSDPNVVVIVLLISYHGSIPELRTFLFSFINYNPYNYSHFLLLQDYFPAVANWLKLRSYIWSQPV